MTEKDRLFAGLYLSSEELNLYNLVDGQIGMNAPAPELVSRVPAPIAVLMERIDRRNVEYERPHQHGRLAALGPRLRGALLLLRRGAAAHRQCRRS